MRIDYLQKILGHVRKGLTCPRCQEVFGVAQVKVLAIRERHLDLSVNCPHCATEARIAAEVTTKKQQIATKAHVTPESVAGLKQSISGLSAQDIEHLG